MILGQRVPDSIENMTRTPRAPRGRRIAAIVTAIVVATVGLSTIAAPAWARFGDPVEVNFVAQSEKFAYGDTWSVEMKLRNHGCFRYSCDSDALVVTLTGPNGISRETSVYVSSEGRAYVGNFQFGTNLPAGTYALTADYNDKHYYGSDPGMSKANKPGKLVIDPAALSIDLRVETDENQPTGAVVSAQLLGDFVESDGGCWEDDVCKRVLADGTWDFTVMSDTGEELFTKTIATKADASRFASFYWHDVPASFSYEAEATFTPVKTSASNFVIDAPGTAAFTSPDAIAVGDPEAEDEPVVEIPSDEDSTIPLWGVVAWLSGLALLLILAIVFAVLIVRQRRSIRPIVATEAGTA